MAGTDDLRIMVMAFRVSELQTLLGFAGRNKTGRKNELQTRALELLRLKSTPIQMKIMELYKSIQQGVAQGQQAEEGGALLSQQQLSHMTGSNYPHYQSQQGRAPAYPDYYPNEPHTTPKNQLKAAGVGIMPNNIPVHPDVQLKHLPFFEHISQLLKPSTLMPVGTARIQENFFVFHLTPAQANELAFNRDLCTSNSDYVVQVQMRFCLLETSCEQDDYFPPGLIVKVNDKACPLPTPIPTNRQGVEPKRPPRPVNISHMVRISPTVPNNIYVSWTAEFGRGYVIAISLVKKLTSVQLLHRLKTRGVRHADYTTGLIKEKLREDADGEIATTSLRVSLMCPLGKMRMGIPCRPTTCTHLQCFDANLYIQMNERKSTWICPVCDKPGLFEKLVIDGYFQEVLNSNKLPQDANEIQLHQDGSWSISMVKKDEKTDSGSSPPVKNRGGPPVIAETVEIADDDIVPVDGESDDEIKNKEDATKKNELSIKTANVTTVDLTLSDDDDDFMSTAVATTNVSNSSKMVVNGKSSPKSPPKAVTPGYTSPNIITLDSPSPPLSPGPPILSPSPSTCPYPPGQLPPFFDLDHFPPLSPSN